MISGFGAQTEKPGPALSSTPALLPTSPPISDRTALSHPVVSPAGRRVASFLAPADIQINGARPWDIRVHDDRFYRRLLYEGSLGAGESYMDGWWDVDALDELVAKIERAGLGQATGRLVRLWLALLGTVFNRQAKSRSGEVAREHYDLGNDLFEAMLDRRMQYTCAYWDGANTLDEAQTNKLHLICRKLRLEPGMTVLELGGGFGGLAHFMATEYGCRVVSYNISREQVSYGRKLCQGLPVRFEEKDYREANREEEPFDRVVSVGLCEHIGPKNYRVFMELAHRRLKGEGLFLLHTIGGNQSASSVDPWIDKYIFPNGVIPSMEQLGKAMEAIWVVEDWHNIGPDYDRTLMAWWENFNGAWFLLRARYGDRFYRMWRLYLLGSAGAFRARKLQVWQLVLSKGDIPSYTPVR